MTLQTLAKSRYAPATLILLQGVFLMLRGLLTLHKHPDQHATDINVYYEYGRHILQGQVPYRDFSLEYPPLALVSFVLPWLLALGHPLGLGTYALLYLVQSVALNAAAGVVLTKTARAQGEEHSPFWVLAVYTVAVLLTALILPWRYDILPALMTLLALQAAAAGRAGPAGVWLGLGVAAKLYPLVLLPVFVLYFLGRRESRNAAVVLVTAAIAAAAPFAPFLVLAPHSLFSFLRYHQQRGLQLEAVPSGLILLRDKMARVPTPLVYNYGAWHLNSPTASLVIKGLPLLFAVLYAGVLLFSRREFRREAADGGVTLQGLALCSTAALLAFMVANKVFSPQYVVWLLPLLPLLRRPYLSLALPTLAITTLLYPTLYSSLLALKTLAILLLNLRNVLVVALLVWILLSNSHRVVLGRMPAGQGV